METLKYIYQAGIITLGINIIHCTYFGSPDEIIIQVVVKLLALSSRQIGGETRDSRTQALKMSGSIRRLLGPTKVQLQTYIKKVKTMFPLPVNEADLDREETEIEDLLHQFSSNIVLLERCNQEWTTLLHGMKGEERAAKEKEYLWAADGDEGLTELLLDSRETVARLEARLAQVLQRGERAKEQSWERPLTSGNLIEPQNNGSVKMKMKLPKLHLPTFDGNFLHWQEFWDVYKIAVHEQDILNVTKFSYLKGSIRNTAATAIYGISVTNDNCPVAIKISLERKRAL